MVFPPSDERREILQPSLLPVPDNSVHGVATTSYHYCISHRVSNGTGKAVIIITNTNNNLTAFKHLLCVIFKREGLLLAPVIFDQSSSVGVSW